MDMLVYRAAIEVNEIHRQSLWHARPSAVPPFQGFPFKLLQPPGRCPGL